LASDRFDKIFTPAEANELIPRLELLIRQVQAWAGALRRKLAEVARFDPAASPPPLPQLIERYPELRESAARMAEVAHKIESYGCVLKDIDQGLVDFPGEVDEDVVFLCWQFGEPTVIAWHPIDGGFAQRKPLAGASKPYLN